MSEKKDEAKDTIKVFIKRPRVYIIILMCYIGLGLIYAGMTKQDITPLIREYGLVAIGFFVLFIAIIMQLEEVSRKKEDADEKFTSVDERRRNSHESDVINNLKNQLIRLKENQQMTYENIEEVLLKYDKLRRQKRQEQYSEFSVYFDGLRELLENKSADADEKASILLDKGTAYSKFGITYFIFAIIIWQVLSFITGFKEQYVYGIVSCSILFIFIEFLSAWFLRQYRNYVDTSTYLVKIKSIFDRYMLSYLALHDSDKDISALTDTLSKDIKWPDSYLMKNADVSFAKEAIEAMTHMAQSIRKDVKRNKANES
ncbi:hypothetical protein QM198_09775 [Serratia marcescens]|uniref:hypothetical protein n=1 Tax=Serratia marcescens TaxID=615 RepID=UPI00294A0876|nr:hypothetical protein [Serratia marcescens]MDV5743116.1 hypothetical protein [Serratia marcescens]MDV5748029.1 hypothetical protein [Serratia marcescens]MDV5779465.1 hypothetical protein [Serratia marcescens]MDV5784406.1 hypothetical protein [Serratia marcescens]MDV5831304.1 hypothetical protein [Serratia marcescens]